MTYLKFREKIRRGLARHPGRTWKQLREELALPYDRPCPEWTKRLEREIGLERRKVRGPAYEWFLSGKAGT